MAVVSVEEFHKALTALNEAHSAYHHQSDSALKDMLRDSVIQRFKLCVELAWKTSMRKLGLPLTAPKPAVREMAQDLLNRLA